MPNKVINLHFEINERGQICAVYGAQLPPDYIAAIITTAAAEIENGVLLQQPAAHSLTPYEKIESDINFILAGGTLNNLPSEDIK